jgi:hypothetical protein
VAEATPVSDNPKLCLRGFRFGFRFALRCDRGGCDRRGFRKRNETMGAIPAERRERAALGILGRDESGDDIRNRLTARVERPLARRLGSRPLGVRGRDDRDEGVKRDGGTRGGDGSGGCYRGGCRGGGDALERGRGLGDGQGEGLFGSFGHRIVLSTDPGNPNRTKILFDPAKNIYHTLV